MDTVDGCEIMAPPKDCEKACEKPEPMAFPHLSPTGSAGTENEENLCQAGSCCHGDCTLKAPDGKTRAFHSHRGTPKPWVYVGKSYTKMDDLGVPPFLEPPK